MSVTALALALAGGLVGAAPPAGRASKPGGFRDVRIERPFDAYLRARPLLMQVTGPRFIRLKGGRRAVLAVASAVPAGEGPGALMEAEKACRLRALAAIVAHRDGVRVTHLEKVEEKTVVMLENGKERATNSSQVLSVTRARAQGVVRGLRVVGRWRSSDGRVLYLALGAVLDEKGELLPADE
jgi:hypothetical protein